MVPGYEAWLADARELIEGRPADPARALKKRPSLAEHATVVESAEEGARRLLGRPATLAVALGVGIVEWEKEKGGSSGRAACSATRLASGTESKDGKRTPQPMRWPGPSRGISLTIRRRPCTETRCEGSSWRGAQCAAKDSDRGDPRHVEPALAAADAWRKPWRRSSVRSTRRRAEKVKLGASWCRCRNGSSGGARERCACRSNRHRSSAHVAELGRGSTSGGRTSSRTGRTGGGTHSSNLVSDLEAFTDKERGEYAGVSRAHGWGREAGGVRAHDSRQSLDGPEAKRRWEDAIGSIAASRYGGLRINPESGCFRSGRIGLEAVGVRASRRRRAG